MLNNLRYKSLPLSIYSFTALLALDDEHYHPLGNLLAFFHDVYTLYHVCRWPCHSPSCPFSGPDALQEGSLGRVLFHETVEADLDHSVRLRRLSTPCLSLTQPSHHTRSSTSSTMHAALNRQSLRMSSPKGNAAGLVKLTCLNVSGYDTS